MTMMPQPPLPHLHDTRGVCGRRVRTCTMYTHAATHGGDLLARTRQLRSYTRSHTRTCYGPGLLRQDDDGATIIRMHTRMHTRTQDLLVIKKGRNINK